MDMCYSDDHIVMSINTWTTICNIEPQQSTAVEGQKQTTGDGWGLNQGLLDPNPRPVLMQ